MFIYFDKYSDNVYDGNEQHHDAILYLLKFSSADNLARQVQETELNRWSKEPNKHKFTKNLKAIALDIEVSFIIKITIYPEIGRMCKVFHTGRFTTKIEC